MQSRVRIPRPREGGFTLIEIIVSLVLVAILGVVVALGITGATKGFIFARESVATAQKGQMALARLTKEFMGISAISASSASSLGFKSLKGGVEANHTVALDGTDLELDGDVLTDQVAGFSLAWYESESDTVSQSTWDSNQKLVEITLTLSGPDNIPATFAKTVRPRNL